MLKSFVSGIIIASVILLLSAPVQAGSNHHPRSQIKRHQRHQPRHAIKRHVRHHRPRHHVRHHRRHYHRHHRGHHHHRRHRVHRPRHKVFVGVHIGDYYRPHYPHGHYQHIHDDYCPVIIVPPVHYHGAGTVKWEVEYHDDYTPDDETSVYLILAPHHGDVYINSQYIGHVKNFNDGEKRVRVPSGNHTIELRTGGQSYTQEVTVNPGVTAVVKAKRR